MRMTPLHLVRNRGRDVVESEQPVVGGDLCMKDDLEQQVAKRVADCRGVADGDRIGDLIGFLDRIGRNRREILRQSPFRSEEHTSELQSLMRISYPVFCSKKKT